MRPFHSVGARLALALAFVVAVALGVAWAVVVPSLERNLIQAKVDQLAGRTPVVSESYPLYFHNDPDADPLALDDWAARTSALANARTVVFNVMSKQPELHLSKLADSRQAVLSDNIADDAVARATALSGRRSQGTVARNGQRYAEVAFPKPKLGVVVLLSSPLEDTLASVHQVKRRLLVAGGAALGIAFLLGYGGASVFARRIRRLERASDRIAGGHLDVPVQVRGTDEVGQLAEAFERMRRQLVRLDHARREFIANASHELRTPIFSLGGFLELLANEELDEATRREFTGTMQEQVQRLEKLATDLLDLSRLDAGQLRLDVERLDMARVAEALADEFAAVAVAGGHTIELSADGVPSEAMGDETRTLQIGRVLVENAIVHTPGGTAVRISVDEEPNRVVLAVEDEGPGIPAEHAAQVFDRFYRLEGAHASGSGLGLAIARELAGAMGGRVELDSRAGRTVFRLALPAAAPVEMREREPALP